jgi:prepilin signal peptidase PulO-like enzyme (type II secretory pathway)
VPPRRQKVQSQPVKPGHTSGLVVWESATGVAQAALPGLLPRRASTPLTLALAILGTAFLWPIWGLTGVPIAVLFARLAAIDLTTYTLPSIYTYPMIAMGAVHAVWAGQGLMVGLIWVVMACLARVLKQTLPGQGLGGGDWALLAALVAFLEPAQACLAVGIGCLAWWPLAWRNPRQMVPFGVPIILGWAVLLRWPYLPESLILAIT